MKSRLAGGLGNRRRGIGRKCAALALGGLLGLAAAGQAGVLPNPGFAPGSGISMRVTNFYEDIPPCGYLPLRVEIKNSSGASRTWTFQTVHSQPGSTTVSFATEIRAEAGREETLDLLVPLASSPGTSRYSVMRIYLHGYGVAGGESSVHAPGRSGNPTLYFGMGGELAVKNWGPLADLVKKRGSRVLDGTALEVDLMPADWRGLAGFQVILLTAAEWRAFPAEARGALRDWVAQGGRLLLGAEGGASRADLPPAGALGTGNVEHWEIDDQLVPRLDSLLESGPDSTVSLTQRNYSWQWEPAKAVGRPEPPQLMILLFVITFAVIIGPVNFFVFAPAGERHRLFWTTPLISVTASLLMGAFIFFSEGAGGSGRRFVAVLSQGEQNRSFVWQEQVSRTGVLFSNAFVPSDASALLLPLQLADKKNTRPWQEQGGSYSLADTRWSGDWFRSRRTQGQLLMAAVPSRGRFEFQPAADGAPSVVSTFEHPMAEIWYFDAAGQAWQGQNLVPGGKATLARGEVKAFDQWLVRTLGPAGPVTSRRVQGFAKSERAGKFFATATAPGLIATLPAIRWKDAEGIVFGRVTP